MACAVIIAVTSCSYSEVSLSPGASGRVVTVIDGDTLDLHMRTGTERVRLIGIDTPETKKPDTPIQCFGPEASARLVTLLPPGVEVVVFRDVEPRDVYGRLLAYIFRFDDGLFVNRDMIVNGFARPLTIAPNTMFDAEFRRLADSARTRKIGLWNACSVTP